MLGTLYIGVIKVLCEETIKSIVLAQFPSGIFTFSLKVNNECMESSLMTGWQDCPEGIFERVGFKFQILLGFLPDLPSSDKVNSQLNWTNQLKT